MRTQHQFLEENIGTSQDENYAFWLVTLLSWLLPTLVIALGLLDPLLAYAFCQRKNISVPYRSNTGKERKNRYNNRVRKVNQKLIELIIMGNCKCLIFSKWILQNQKLVAVLKIE